MTRKASKCEAREKSPGLWEVTSPSGSTYEVDLGRGAALRFNRDILHSDFVVDLPVLKAHAQSVVSLAIKNLKGILDIDSRKKAHFDATDGEGLEIVVRLLEQIWNR